MTPATQVRERPPVTPMDSGERAGLCCGSLFSGVGGFDLGLSRAGFDVAWMVEIDPKCRSVLRRHWPDTAIHEDVRHVGRANLAPVDLICGGFPCQDLSVAGKRAGLAGARSGLFHEFMRIAGELAPRWLLIENVPGLLSSDGGGDMGTVLGTLGKLGYWWTYRVFDSRYFDLAQRRERVFVVGHLGAFCPPEILLEPSCLPGDLAPGREAWEGTAGELEGGAGGEGGAVGYSNTGRGWWTEGAAGLRSQPGGTPENIVANALPTKYRGDPHEGTDTLVTDTLVTHTLNAAGRSATEDGTGRGVPIVAHTLRAASHDASEDGTGRGTPIVLGFNATQDPISTPDGMHALSDAGAAVLAFDTTQITSPTVPRRLTPVECSRLQGFPDSWNQWGVTEDGERVELSDSTRYAQLGNAVSVPVAAWIGGRLARAVVAALRGER